MAETPEQVAAAEAAAAAKAVESQKALETMVQGAVRTSIEALVKEGQTKAQEAAAERVAEEASKAAGKTTTPFDEMLRPVLEPVLAVAKSAEMRAAMAADAVAFFTDPANTQAMPHRARISEVAAQQAKKGNPITMKDAWSWLRGGELYDTIVKDQEAGYTAKIEEARKAATVGPSTPVFRPAKPIDDMNTEELGAALKGIPF